MTYIVIDPIGVLHQHPGPATYPAVRAAVGGTPAPVRLDPTEPFGGWVNDNGHQRPDEFPRNIIGSCVLASLGAAMYPYAGPVVITCVDRDPESGMPVDLSNGQLAKMVRLHRIVGLTLAEEDTGLPNTWSQVLRRYAETVATGPTPTLQVTSFGSFDALAAHLNRGEH